MSTAFDPAIRHPAAYAPPCAPLSYDAMVLASKRRAMELRRQQIDAALSSAGHLVLRSLHLCEKAGARAVRRWMPQG